MHDAWASHLVSHPAPDGIEVYARALALGWSESALSVCFPHGTSALFALSVDRDRLEIVRRDPVRPWLPGERIVHAREELERGFAGETRVRQVSNWCPCCAFARTCDACIATGRAKGRAIVTLCMCAGRGPREGHAPGCPDADQPWGPPYLLPIYKTEERWRRVDDPAHWRGWRWEKDTYTRVTGWRRVETDSEEHEKGAIRNMEEMQETRDTQEIPETLIAVLDTETTGLFDRPRGFVPRIVEIAVALVSVPSGKVVGFKSTRVNPEAPIPFQASAVHGIRDRDVQGAPVWAQVYPRVSDFIEASGAVCVVAHNATYDRDMVHSDCTRAACDWPAWSWCDSMKLARRHLPGRGSYALQKLRESLGLPEPQHGAAHSAAADVGTVAQLVVKCLRGRSWEECAEGLIERANPLLTKKIGKGASDKATQQGLDQLKAGGI